MTLAQFKDPDVQRIIHIIRDNELPPNHFNFNVDFSKNCSITVVDSMLPTTSSTDSASHTGKVKSYQIVMSNNIVHSVIMTLRDYPMHGHPGSSNKLGDFVNVFTPLT